MRTNRKPTAEKPYDRLIALAGNPNVGKSTIFNALTGMRQHTGNWTGKTVANAFGECVHRGKRWRMADLPGTYSLLSGSEEERVARDFLCFGQPDAVIAVCDATCLERHLHLVLQILEITRRVVVCVNLLDEAEKKQLHLDLPQLQKNLGVPVVGVCARDKKGLKALLDAVEQQCALPSADAYRSSPHWRYTKAVEAAVAELEPMLTPLTVGKMNVRFAALRLLERDDRLTQSLTAFLGDVPDTDGLLERYGLTVDQYRDNLVACLMLHAEEMAADVVSGQACCRRDRRLDRILTGKFTGIPLMLLLLCGLLWITVEGANVPSGWLSRLFVWGEGVLTQACEMIGMPQWLYGMTVEGMYRVASWVISVMLPPMAIFFPLFTLLEDFGYLPRVAFALDRGFQRCGTCGKQALTMCMGLGCNAVGVSGARIIDSPRERLIAVLTNSLTPCNGRFPTLITLATLFLAVSGFGTAALLTAVLVLSVAVTLFSSHLLSRTVLKGKASSFVLELPPYRPPQVGRVLIRSVLDRTLRVLGRAVCVALPAGLIIWLIANVYIGDLSLLAHIAGFFDPFARLMGMDGVIFTAFLLSFPANELTLPIAVMAYTAQGSPVSADPAALHALLTANGWTWCTAVCVMLFTLMHWPCSTTCLTVHKETKSWGWTAVSFILPTLLGMAVCLLVNALFHLTGCV